MQQRSAIGWGLLRVQRLRTRAQAHTAALAEPGRPALAILTADPEDDPTLLVTDPLVTPTVLTAVVLQRPLPAGTAASFPQHRARAVRVHGRLAEGEAVAVELDDVSGHLLPAGPAYRPSPLDLLFLLDSASAFTLDESELDDAAP